MSTIIVGAGLVGTMTAYFLAKDGHEVTLVERREGPALETSFACLTSAPMGQTEVIS